jgi:hypothetical protein
MRAEPANRRRASEQIHQELCALRDGQTAEHERRGACPEPYGDKCAEGESKRIGELVNEPWHLGKSGDGREDYERRPSCSETDSIANDPRERPTLRARCHGGGCGETPLGYSSIEGGLRNACLGCRLTKLLERELRIVERRRSLEKVMRRVVCNAFRIARRLTHLSLMRCVCSA